MIKNNVFLAAQLLLVSILLASSLVYMNSFIQTAKAVSDSADTYNSVTLATPTLSISCQSSTSYSAFNVEIQGSLILDGVAIPDAAILLANSVNGGTSWQDLALLNADSHGRFSFAWLPSVTGTYMIRATYEGDDNYSGTSTTVNMALTHYAQKNVFAVTSNSTVSSLSFNLTSRTLSFNITGDSGTTGYADVYIAKTLVWFATGIEVLLDGNRLDYAATDITTDSWLFHFSYAHSTHIVAVRLGLSEWFDTEIFGNWVIIGVMATIIAVILIIVAVFLARRKKAKKA